jgi:putative transposase
LRIRLRQLVGSRVRYGCRRLIVLLKREGWEVNAKRIYRLYAEKGLIVRTKKRKERAQRQRVAQGSALRPDQKGSMDFVTQRLPDRRWIRVLTVVDQFTRECVTLLADNTLSGGRNRAGQGAAAARRAGVDHRGQRPEFVAEDLRKWLAKTGAKTLYIEPGSSWENGHCESFNSKLRDACLNVGGVLRPDRRESEAASLAMGLQLPSPTLGAGRPHASGIRRHLRCCCRDASLLETLT